MGSIHNGKSKKFYDGWTPNDKIGMLYDPLKKTLTYFRNGVNIGTPFDNVEGDALYLTVEMCHLGSFTRIESPELPNEEEIEKEDI